MGALPRHRSLNWARDTKVAGGRLLSLILLRIWDTPLKHLFLLPKSKLKVNVHFWVEAGFLDFLNLFLFMFNGVLPEFMSL